MTDKPKNAKIEKEEEIKLEDFTPTEQLIIQLFKETLGITGEETEYLPAPFIKTYK